MSYFADGLHLVDKTRANETRQHRDANASVSNEARRVQAEALALRWLERSRGRGKPSRQQLGGPQE
eukprot:2137701-Amphidinium_carterae.1